MAVCTAIQKCAGAPPMESITLLQAIVRPTKSTQQEEKTALIQAVIGVKYASYEEWRSLLKPYILKISPLSRTSFHMFQGLFDMKPEERRVNEDMLVNDIANHQLSRNLLCQIFTRVTIIMFTFDWNRATKQAKSSMKRQAYLLSQGLSLADVQEMSQDEIKQRIKSEALSFKYFKNQHEHEVTARNRFFQLWQRIGASALFEPIWSIQNMKNKRRAHLHQAYLDMVQGRNGHAAPLLDNGSNALALTHQCYKHVLLCLCRAIGGAEFSDAIQDFLALEQGKTIHDSQAGPQPTSEGDSASTSTQD
ncbi:hypothetical protein GLOTRDRAFT_91446 [Gloeophyllum trabeum ATCC 11539]|uniref:Uncharacterized protein n=1 Tax=Gloeophyllum trabeum (strain ATCC 11539 / FP-39264 / Madison 617) TaxID=670483 RepID=S7QDC9_GLOTA|nr:uncharacterized protein GLOTRDRAFT_91446 [Gloeophyllum trabeum ATCC 11539]EPQ57846.1 hypothetical protein GLOTRDRAFT_91446 [Gloeophyllum trabeum ATCC 11539]